MLKFETEEQKRCLLRGAIVASAVGGVLLILLLSLGRLTPTPFVLTAILWGVIAYLLAEACQSGKADGADEADPAPAPKPAPVAKPAAKPAPSPAAVDRDGDGVVEGKDEGTRPATLSAPRDGAADDLKRIKGIGPKLEAVCNKLGFYHFDQIAAWTPDEVAWVDSNLEGFQGRVTRDDWVAQAKLLASGGETEFSKRVDDGSVPSSR